MSSDHRMFELTEQQCLERLAGHAPGVGRIAFAEGGDPNWPTVLPVNYAFHDQRIYVRTFEGSKLYAALRGQRVAFEIDVLEEAWSEGWSVVAVGRLALVDDAGERATVDTKLRSWAGGPPHMVRLDVEQLTGREVFGGAAR